MPSGELYESDQELLKRYRQEKDSYWLGILFQRYTLLLYGVCMKYLRDEDEAKDCVQQVYLKAITELNKYPIQYFKSWVYMVAKNDCLMRLREKGKAAASLESRDIPDESDPGARYGHLEKDRKLELLSSTLADLNAEQKQCVTLFYLEKKSYQEIAAATGFTIMKVKSHIQNGKRNLRLLLEKKLKNK